MNKICDCRCPAGMFIDPQPLNFGRPEVQGDQVTYRAVVPQPPSDPLFRLTVSTVIPEVGKEDSEQELRFLLASLRADFFLTSLRDEDEDDDENENDGEDEPDPDPDYLDWEINLTPEFISTKLQGDYGVVFVVEAPIPLVSEYVVAEPLQPSSVGGPLVPLPSVPSTRISKRTMHIYYSATGQPVRPTVTSDMNTVHIYPGNIKLHATQHSLVSKKATKVTIVNRSYRRPAKYHMNLSWSQPTVISLPSLRAGRASSAADPDRDRTTNGDRGAEDSAGRA